MNNNFLEKALYYKSLGWSIFPCKVINTGNNKFNKKPLVQWGIYQQRLATDQEINEWAVNFSDAGIGVATGELSGIIVLDQDLGGNVDKFNLPKTVQSKTGSGGSHYFFKYKKGIRNSASLIGPKLDIRGEGGYVILPDTKYSENSFYEWINSPENNLGAPLPESILNALSPKTTGSGQEIVLPTKKYEQTEPISEGEGRNNAAASYTGLLLNKTEPAMWESVAWPALQAWDQKMCRPTLGKELRQVFDSMTKTDLRNNPLKVSLSDKSVSKEAIYAQLKRDFFHVDDKGRKKVSPFGIQKIADYFVNNYHVKTMGGEKLREIYLYDGGIYQEEGSSFFKAELEKILEEAWSNHWQSEIIEKIKNLSYISREEFTVPKEFINLKNGIYNIKTKELLPHSPEFLFTHQFPLVYDPNADCPKIKKFFSEVFDASDLQVIREWFGFSLYRQYFIKKALIIFGAKNTGKSTFINILLRFIGILNAVAIPLQNIRNDKSFITANLYSKHLNICDDLSASDLSDNGAFKIATGGGPMNGEYKFGDSFSFVNFAKLLFACNKIPAPSDVDDDAYFSRWMLINLQKTINEEDIDNFLLDKLLTEEEMSGLLNFALTGLNRLLAEGKFSYMKDSYAVKVEMLKSNSSIAEFAYDRLEKQIGIFISSQQLYSAYVNYADEKGLATENESTFGRDLPKYVGYAIKRTGVEITKQVRGWGNVKIKEQKVDPNVPF